MTSSSRRKPRTTAPSRAKSDPRAGRGWLWLGVVVAIAGIPAAADQGASPAVAAPPPAGRVLRASRSLRPSPRPADTVVTASGIEDAKDGGRDEPPALPGPTGTPSEGMPSAVDRPATGADKAPARGIDRPPPRREPARDEARRRSTDDAAGEPDSGSRAGSRARSGDRGAARRESARKDPCAESAKAGQEARQFLRDDDIASIDLDIRVGGKPGNDYPCECLLEGETFQPRRFASTTMTWKAAGYCHKPLYFEDWELERYGHSRGMFLDPFIAGAHFFVTLPILPYKAGMQAPWECVYPLGYYRPGSCAPWTVPAVPYSARGFAVQGATVTGLVFLLP